MDAVALVPIQQIARNTGRDVRTIIAKCERLNIEVVTVSPHVRGIGIPDCARLIAAVKHGAPAMRPRRPRIAGTEDVTASEGALLDILRAINPALRDRFRVIAHDLSAPSGERLPSELSDALAAVLAEPSLTAQEAA